MGPGIRVYHEQGVRPEAEASPQRGQAEGETIRGVGILMTANQIQRAVDAILKGLDPKDFPHEPINWGDLRCTEVREMKLDGSFLVIIEEATREAAKLRETVRRKMLENHNIRCWVFMEW
jgi:hypothetical protein